MQMKRAFQVAFAVLLAASACALEVVYDGRTPEGHRAWADRNYIREQMEVLGEKICKATVPDSQLSLAIGNKGQNVRLAAKLTNWKIDIRPESGFFGEDDDEAAPVETSEENTEISEAEEAENTTETEEIAQEAEITQEAQTEQTEEAAQEDEAEKTEETDE